MVGLLGVGVGGRQVNAVAEEGGADGAGDRNEPDQKARERQRVGVDHPLLAGSRHVKRRAHLRQRDVDDRHVADDHELGHAGDS
jgi:hypothetical protein